MLIGLISDSHGKAALTCAGVRALQDAGAELIIHLGDLGSTAVIDELVGRPARIVFGNCDDERDLARYAACVGVHVDHPAGRIEAGGKRVAFTHGHLEPLVASALREGVEYLCHGHTHVARDERIGPTRVINPGALVRAQRYTVAILDPERDRVEFIDLAKAGREPEREERLRAARERIARMERSERR